MNIRKHLITRTFLFGMLISELHAQTTTKIKVEQLPETAQADLVKIYSKYQVNSMVQKEDVQGQTSYKIELQKKNKLVYLLYNNEGTLVSKRKSKSFTFDGMEPVKKPAPRANDGHNHTH